MALPFILTHYGALALLVLLAWALGGQALRAWRFASAAEQFVFAVTLGLGIVAYAIMGLGLMRLLDPFSVTIAAGVGLWWSRSVWLGWPQSLAVAARRLAQWDKLNLALLVLVSLLVLWVLRPLLIAPLLPPTGFDATLYHLPLAKLYVQQRQLVYAEFVRVPVFPQTMEMLFTLALLVYDEVLAQLIEWLMLMLTLVALWAWARRMGAGRIGLWGALFIVLNPLTLWLAGSAYIDLGLMAFACLTCYAFDVWRRTAEARWLVLAGVFAGFAVGTKYTALLLLGLLLLAAWWIAGQRAAKATLWQTYWPASWRLAGVASLLAAPWYVRNFYYTRNPVFPFMHATFIRWFGTARWQSESSFDFSGTVHSASATEWLAALWQTPWNLLVTPQLFLSETRLALWFFRLVPLLLLAAFVRRRLRGWALLAYAYLIFWAVSAPQVRYLYLILPLLALLFGDLAHALTRWVQMPDTRGGLVLALVLLGGAALVWHRVQWRFPQFTTVLPVTQAERTAFLASRLPVYPAYQLLNQKHGSNYGLYALGAEELNYFAEGQAKGDWFGPAAYHFITEQQHDSAALLRVLQGFGAQYFLQTPKVPLPQLARDEFFQTHFKPLLQTSAFTLYQLIP